MVTRDEMLELVQAHMALEEPMETAIWIRPEDREAWLVELIPSMVVDAHPERPVAFNPGRSFRHPLNLIASNRDGLLRAMEVDHALARDIAAGHILHGDRPGRELQGFAQANNGHVDAG